MNHVVFLGSVYPEQLENELIQLGSSIDYASHTLEMSMLEGLNSHVREIDFITSPSVTCYPYIKKIKFDTKDYVNRDGKIFHFAGFFNISLFRLFSKLFMSLKILNIYAREDSLLLVYAATTPYLLAALIIKLLKKCKICLVVPDLPEYMSGSKKPLYRVLKAIDKRLLNCLMNCVDNFVLLSPYMKDKLPVGRKPWCQMEGIYNTAITIPPVEKDSHKVILYTGKLEDRYCIKELVSAFKVINSQNLRLWVRGDGSLKDYIVKESYNDNRIVYIDKLSKQDLLLIQQKATILINPVFSSREFTKYFFPSKTMEYLASGTPTLMCRLKCLPEEYLQHLLIIEEETEQGIVRALLNALDKTDQELYSFGQDARKFVISQKNPYVQMEKILSLCGFFNN